MSKYSPETFSAKSPGGVHLFLKQPKLNEGERAHVASIMDAKVGSSVPGATWREGIQAWRRNNKACLLQ